MNPFGTPIDATTVSGTRKKRKSPADLRRDAARAQKRIEQRLSERSDAWAEGGRSEYLVVRQDGDTTPCNGADAYLHHETAGSLKGLNVEKRHAMHGLRLGSKELS